MSRPQNWQNNSATHYNHYLSPIAELAVFLTFLIFGRRLTVRGKRVLQRSFHRSLSVVHSSLIFQASRSLLTVSFHLNFCLPLGRLPSIFISTTARMFSVQSLLLTCPNNSSILLLLTIAIGSTFASSKIFSFIRCSNMLTPPPLHNSHSCCCYTRFVFN